MTGQERDFGRKKKASFLPFEQVTSHFYFALQILQWALWGTEWVCVYCTLVLVRMLQGKDGSVHLGVEHQLLCVSVAQRPHRGGHYHCSCIWNNWPKALRMGETKKVWTGAREVLIQLASSVSQIGSTLPLYLALTL